jgi:tetratricopeptide (TPR) repeat protein
VTLAVAFLGIAGFYVAPHLRAFYHARAADRALARWDFDAARAHLAICLDVWPNGADTLLQAARTARRSGHFDEAERYLTHLQRSRGISEKTEIEWALLSVERGDVYRVEAYLKETVGPNHPDAPLVYEALARGYLHTDRLVELLQDTDDWLQIRRGDPHALYYRGWAWERLGNLQEALSAYRDSVAADPDNPEARLRLADLMLHDQAAPEALEHYQRAHALRPSDIAATLGLARCLKALGNMAAARELLDGVLAEHPDHPRALTERGQLALEDENDPALAERWLQRAVAVDPADQEALSALVRTMTMQSKHEEAKKWEPRLKQLREDLERYKEIVRIVAKEPRNLALRTEAARICLRLGRDSEAKRWIASVLQIDPSYQPAHAALKAAEDENEFLPEGDQQGPEMASTQFGVTVNDARAFKGYTLVYPLGSTKTYLVDMQGRIVQMWESKYTPGQMAVLLENGHLLRPAKLSDSEALFAGAGPGGRVQEFTWEGQLVWDFKFHNTRQIQHHAVTRMPNGNIMMIVWERKTPSEVLGAGVKPDASSKSDMLVDSLVEIRPTGLTGGKIVWEWHLWDHLVQDYDQAKPNYGDVAAHPELIDVNCARGAGLAFDNLCRAIPKPPGPRIGEPGKPDPKRAGLQNDSVDKLRSIGYVGAGGGNKNFMGYIADWTHVNAVAYNAKLDQLMLSSREFSEIWIIDHGTTTAEAKGHSGGHYGKGGDLLYRWGNPANYRSGTPGDQKLFFQHDAHWIPEGLPGAGHVLLFNNGERPAGDYSTVDEIVLPADSDGRYERAPGKAFGPDEPLWSYAAPRKEDFFGRLLCGAQRLPNGNTLIAMGFSSRILEVTPGKELVWNYAVPPDSSQRSGWPGGHAFPFPTPALSVVLVPDAVADFAQVKPENRQELDALDEQVSAALDRLLTEQQRKQLKRIQRSPGDTVEIGQVIPAATLERLRLTPDQREQLDRLQEESAARLGKILTPHELDMARKLVGTVKSFVGLQSALISRANRYGADYPGLAGKDLTPSTTIDKLPSAVAK